MGTYILKLHLDLYTYFNFYLYQDGDPPDQSRSRAYFCFTYFAPEYVINIDYQCDQMLMYNIAQILSTMVQKAASAVFFLKSDILVKSPKSYISFGPLLYENVSPGAFKNCKLWSHWVYPSRLRKLKFFMLTFGPHFMKSVFLGPGSSTKSMSGMCS